MTGLNFFTDSARQAFDHAQDEARILKHGIIGTEHLLLGLLVDPDTTAARALACLDITLATVREDVVQLHGGPGDRVSTAELPYSSRAKHVRIRSQRYAHLSGAVLIDTEHLLIATVSGNGVATQVFRRHGIDISEVRQQVLQQVASNR